jgi:hypothetical protein
MQTETRRAPLKRSFFSRLDEKDLRISVIFALFTFALSLLICSRAWAQTNSASWILLFLLEFPLSLSLLEDFARGIVIGFGPVGGLVAIIPLFIISFIFKVIIFYLLARFSRKILGQRDTFLLRHLPSLLICIVCFSFFIFSMGQCR